MTQHNHLEHWLAQEREVLAALDAGPGPGVATREQIAHLNASFSASCAAFQWRCASLRWTQALARV